MDNKKFEQLIDLIINENEEQAKALFHDIVVEKSREIYESMMMDDAGMGGQVGDLMDEISAEESGVIEGEDEDEFDMTDIEDDGGEVIDIEAGEDEEAGEGDIEDRVVDLEDKLDQLMAEFEEIMGGDDAEVDGEEDFEAGEEEGEFDAEEGDDEMMEADDMEEDTLEESVQLKNVPGLYGSKIGGDDGANTKSVALTKPKVVQTGANPVKFSGDNEAVPTSPKAPSNAYAKGETQVKGAGSFKNAPAQNNFKEKGESTPKPVTKDEAGKVKSPVAESRTAKKRI
jgi:hypothetical protein